MKFARLMLPLTLISTACAVPVDDGAHDAEPTASEPVVESSEALRLQQAKPGKSVITCFFQCTPEFNECMKDAKGDKSLEWWCDRLMKHCMDTCTSPSSSLPLSIQL